MVKTPSCTFSSPCGVTNRSQLQWVRQDLCCHLWHSVGRFFFQANKVKLDFVGSMSSWVSSRANIVVYSGVKSTTPRDHPSYWVPWEPKTFIFRGYNPYIGGWKPSFFMVWGPRVVSNYEWLAMPQDLGLWDPFPNGRTPLHGWNQWEVILTTNYLLNEIWRLSLLVNYIRKSTTSKKIKGLRV